MSCERVRARILDLALDERTGDAVLRAHLESCAACRDALASHRSLLVAVDRVLSEELQETPSSLFAARVRRAIDDAEARPRAWRWAGWAAATLTAALLIGLLIQGFLAPVPESIPTASAPEQVLPETPAAGTHADEVVKRPPDILAGRRRTHVRRTSRVAAASRSFPEVIVPPGEIAAALWLSANAALPAREQQDDPVPAQRLDPLSIEQIQIAPLTLTPLGAAPTKL